MYAGRIVAGLFLLVATAESNDSENIREDAISWLAQTESDEAYV